MIKEIDSESRRILINAQESYMVLKDAYQAGRHYRGGMRWKRTNEREYLFHTRDGRGNGKSMGVRNSETEQIYDSFHKNKRASKERIRHLNDSLKRQSRFCIAAALNRVPAVSSKILRLLDQEGLLKSGVMVIGTHAMYGYEADVGVQFDASSIATEDIDLLFNSRAGLKISGELETAGLISLLQRADKSFELCGDGHFRAANSRGFMVDLVKATPANLFEDEGRTIGSASVDLVATEMEGFVWLSNAPGRFVVAIGSDGYPVPMYVPDPRFYAVNKAWIADQPNRDPKKRPRDLTQAMLAADVATRYLNLSFDDPVLKVFPKSVMDHFRNYYREELAEEASPFDEIG